MRGAIAIRPSGPARPVRVERVEPVGSSDAILTVRYLDEPGSAPETFPYPLIEGLAPGVEGVLRRLPPRLGDDEPGWSFRPDGGGGA